MPFTMNLWRIEEDHLREITESQINTEERLEDWISRDPSILGLDIAIIGRQVRTEFGGVVDLLGIHPSGDVVIIELKKDRTPREIVAQVLDYASWVRVLNYQDLNSIAVKYHSKSLADVFSEYFSSSIPETVNSDHSLIIVAARLDDSSERIVSYLTNEHGVNINSVFFTYFKSNQGEFLGRAWLFDPTELQERSESRRHAPWTGYWFVNVGEEDHRNWDDNSEYGYIGAGQDIKYSKPLKNLSIGDQIFAYLKGKGYVGYGRVIREACMIRDFVVQASGRNLLDEPLKASLANENSDDPDTSEWVVGIDWQKTYPREDARTFKGVFANQNIVCKLRHETTLEFLMREFGLERFD